MVSFGLDAIVNSTIWHFGNRNSYYGQFAVTKDSIKMKIQKTLVLLALIGPSVDAGCATQEWLAAGRPLQVQYVFDVHMYTTPLLLDESLVLAYN